MLYEKSCRNSVWLSSASLIALILTIALSSASCANKRQILTRTVSDTVIVTKTCRDTVLTIEPDSALVRAVIECDSTGNVLMREIETERGKRIAAELKIKSQSDGTAVIDVECKEDSLRRQIAILEYRISKLKTIQDSLVLYVDKPLTWWQKTKMQLGVYSTILLIMIIFILAIMFFKR